MPHSRPLGYRRVRELTDMVVCQKGRENPYPGFLYPESVMTLWDRSNMAQSNPEAMGGL